MVDLVVAKEVVFLKSFCEDVDFVERGMKAWLTKIERNEKYTDDTGETFDLYFDFTEFEDRNDKYLTKVFYANSDSGTRALVTAKESGNYSNKISCMLFVPARHNFDMTLQEYVRFTGREDK